MTEYNFHQGFERLANAWSGKGDRPPVFAQLHEFALRQSGESGKKFYQNPEIFVKGILNTSKNISLDIPDIVWDAYNLEAEALGVKVFFEDNASPALDQTPIIENEKDLAALKIPDPEASGRYGFAMDCMEIFRELTGVASPHSFCSPMSLATLLIGYEKIVMAAYTNPDFVHKVLTVITEEVIAPYINAVFNRFEDCPAADGADALSSLPFLTQEMLENFSVPYILRLRELCGDRVVVRNWWGDSFSKDLDAFWDMKMKVGNKVLEVQDPDLFKIGPDKVMAYAKKQNCPVILGVDQTLLANGTPGEIEERVKEYIRVGGQNRKLVLYLCNLNFSTPPENIAAAVSAVNEYGWYEEVVK